MLVLTVPRSWRRPESIEDQFSTDIGCVVQVSKPDLMAGGVAVCSRWPSELARSAKPPNTKICSGRKVSPWIASLLMIEGAIKPYGDDTVELSMKASMSVSKPADLG